MNDDKQQRHEKPPHEKQSVVRQMLIEMAVDRGWPLSEVREFFDFLDTIPQKIEGEQ